MENSRITEIEKENLEDSLAILDSANRDYIAVSKFIRGKYESLEHELSLELGRKAELEQRIVNIKNSIRNKALEIYMRNREEGKEVYKGIKERDVVELVYEDVEALRWCLDHGIFLQIDRSKFEKFMRRLDTEDIPTFVQRSIRSTITLPSSIKDENNG